MHYQSSFEKHKHDVKKTWHTIKEIIQKISKRDQFPDSFKVDGEMVYDTLLPKNLICFLQI